ncbi:MAG: Holliday junction branch migration protein RuvA [Pseudomonadota bacterium]
MIGKISGRIDYVSDDHVLILTAGVGYIVYCAPTTLRALPEPGAPAALYTDMVVREDLMQLYGFLSLAERDWHRLLVSVQGVGAKVSLAILGTLGVSGLNRALAAGDAASVKASPGVGPKLATRIVTELKGKAPDMMVRTARQPSAVASVASDDLIDEADAPPPPQVAASAPDTDIQATADALSALVNLGYDRIEAAEAVAEAAGESPDDAGDLIKASLKLLGRNL